MAMFCSIKIFLAFHLLLSYPCFLWLPFPPSPSRFSVFFFISDPFFMHYSITLNSHLQCITSSRLPQTHFPSASFSLSVTLPPFFLPPSLSSIASRHFSLLPCFTPFIIPLSLLWSRHLILNVSPSHIFLSHLVCLPLHIRLPFSILIGYSKHPMLMWLQYCLLSMLFYNTTVQMSANVISSKCKWKFRRLIVPFEHTY